MLAAKAMLLTKVLTFLLDLILVLNYSKAEICWYWRATESSRTEAAFTNSSNLNTVSVVSWGQMWFWKKNKNALVFQWNEWKRLFFSLSGLIESMPFYCDLFLTLYHLLSFLSRAALWHRRGWTHHQRGVYSPAAFCSGRVRHKHGQAFQGDRRWRFWFHHLQ